MASAPLILVVEDDPDIRESLCELLASWGYVTVTASNGRAALFRLANGEKPDLILLDLMMPVMNGQGFREEQLKHPDLAAIPVIAISAGGSTNGVVDMEVLRKPFDIETLRARVRRYC